jgi:flagellar hook-associated protein 3 FlgL
MISSLSASAQSFLVDLSQIQAADQQAQAELTTGLKINTVSDAPDQISTLLATRSSLAQTQQVETNLTQVNTEVNTAESTLESSVTLVERALTLGTEGASSVSTPDSNQNLANELGTVLQQLVSNANTTVEGRYIFSGDADQTTPYSIDLTQTNPISAYQGSAATRMIQGADGSQFAVSLTAQDIFDSPDATQNVFTSINNLRTALLNNDTAGANAALADVQSSDAYLNQQLAFYGTVQDRVSAASDYAQNYDTQLQTQISGIQDANEAEVITNMTQLQTQEQAALESRGQLPKNTLFDYLA